LKASLIFSCFTFCILWCFGFVTFFAHLLYVVWHLWMEVWKGSCLIYKIKASCLIYINIAMLYLFQAEVWTGCTRYLWKCKTIFTTRVYFCLLTSKANINLGNLEYYCASFLTVHLDYVGCLMSHVWLFHQNTYIRWLWFFS
jgi:hypothetical protein